MRTTRFYALALLAVALAILAVALALLFATASAQHQVSSDETEGLDVDAQAARDAEAYLTEEEKSVNEIGNVFLKRKRFHPGC